MFILTIGRTFKSCKHSAIHGYVFCLRDWLHLSHPRKKINKTRNLTSRSWNWVFVSKDWKLAANNSALHGSRCWGGSRLDWLLKDLIWYAFLIRNHFITPFSFWMMHAAWEKVEMWIWFMKGSALSMVHLTFYKLLIVEMHFDQFTHQRLQPSLNAVMYSGISKTQLVLFNHPVISNQKRKYINSYICKLHSSTALMFCEYLMLDFCFYSDAEIQFDLLLIKYVVNMKMHSIFY